MQITKCYVQNFGKLQNYTIELNKNLNNIIENNGWGKSTLATFIKAMLFGLNYTTKKDLDENERQKYATWGKDSFGGYIEFVLNNHPYRLERTFGTKANQDSAALYDLITNKPCKDYSTNIMEEYFGINGETFERSTYIAQGHISTEINDGIRAKLGNLLQNEQQNNFESAIKQIMELRKQKQVYRGKGGEIDDIKQKIDNTNLKLSQALQQKEQLSILQIKFNQELAQIEQKQNELKQLENQLSQLDKQHAQNVELERYDELQQNLQKLKQQYEELIAFFNNQIPTQQILNQVQGDINSYNSKQVELSTYSPSSNEDLNELKKFFANKLPTNEQIDEIIKLEQHAKTLQQSAQQTIIDRTTNLSQKHAPYYWFLSVIFIALGIGIAVFKDFIIGAIVGSLGVVGLIVGIIIICIQKNKLKNKQLQQNLDEQKRNNQQQKHQQLLTQEIQNINNKVHNFIAQYMTPTQFAQDDLNTIKFNLSRYNFLNKNEQLSKQKIDAVNSELVNLKSNLDRFFAVYFKDFSQNYQTMLNAMHQKVLEYQNVNNNITECTNTIKEYIKKTGIDPTKKVTPVELEQSAILNEQKNKLQIQLNELNHLHGQTSAAINNLTQETENIDIYQNELQIYKDEEQEILHQINVLDNIKKYLERANDNLNSKYITPMTNRFNYYVGLLSSTPLNVSLNSDLNFLIEEQGAKRDKKHLSIGYRDILNICMRFALVDAIFPDEQPPIILDDPFVNLDEQNTKNALALINKISNEKQIIYLACHPSRINK